MSDEHRGTEPGWTATVEVGRGPRPLTCSSCGRKTMTTTGFVYRDGDAYAIYHAAVHHHPEEPRVDLGLGIGTWGSDDSVADASAFLAVWPKDSEVQFGFVDPSESAWAEARLLRNQLSAHDARISPLRSDVLYAAEAILRSDPILRDHVL